MLDGEVLEGAVALVAALNAGGYHLATAESCTGGLLAGAVTAVAGSSAVFDQGFVTYSNEAKHRLLGVPESLLAAYGAVSNEVAAAMASGLRNRAHADFAVSVTGIAGPGGGSDLKPVGLVYFGIAGPNGVKTYERRFGELGRDAVRQNSVLFALKSVLQAVVDV